MGRPKGFNRSEVLEKTAKLFWRKGFAQTSLADIEKSTGVNKSGLYTEFADKDDVYVESLAHYISNSGAFELLSKEPLGWKNIEALLLVTQTCDGQKGCFVVSSIRESQIIPSKAKAVISDHMSRLKSAVEENFRAEGFGEKSALLADLLLTFNSGLCLETNIKSSGVLSEKKAEGFLKILKTLSK